MSGFLNALAKWTMSFVILGLIVSTILSQFFTELLERLGLNGAHWARLLSEAVRHPWVGYGLTAFGGFIMGILLFSCALRFDASRTLDLRQLGAKLSDIESKLAKLERAIWQQNSDFTLAAIERAVNRTHSVEISLNRMGLDTPHIDYDVDPVGFVERMRRYLSKIAPLIEDGHKRTAVDLAKKISEEIRRESPTA